ncbi:polysaccharide pyruvyl transferase family protein [Bifidobacterium oedipodis]|uniref:Polysaccharide pyruvyl transferase n=1 Tax=Bifidobacterium oedipodis TaxID=2675322 RepID=A0A7Y0ERT1_9BIFI|nr:polysaccharide pyruvyl transferase family protein [Bifidobacterium sp. DSM 109957]NMM95227.1 Polysaccharide pyruvyl transferase [Bifidobacterium sp. DSM 109957]
MSRDIYVSTIIDSYNYGTVLQSVATKDLLDQYGNPLFVDYCRPDWTKTGLRDIYLKDGKHNLLINIIRYAAALPELRANRKLFRNFVTQRLPLVDADKFINGGEFDNEAIYCVGSDQTWNEELNKGIDPVYTLMNVPASCRKITVSASFGRLSIPADEEASMKPLLKQFNAISVRESSSVKILEHMGITGSVALKDPVLLCRPEFWHELSATEPKYNEPYVLVYMLNKNECMTDYAKNLAAKLGIKTRVVTFTPRKPAPEGCESICQPTPEQWLAVFRDASYVVTDSFHGTCFSILFEKPLVVFNPPRFSVRLADVLNDFNLSERRVADNACPEDIDVDEKAIDWASVRCSLVEFRSEGKRFLDGCLSQNNNGIAAKARA